MTASEKQPEARTRNRGSTLGTALVRSSSLHTARAKRVSTRKCPGVDNCLETDGTRWEDDRLFCGRVPGRRRLSRRRWGGVVVSDSVSLTSEKVFLGRGEHGEGLALQGAIPKSRDVKVSRRTGASREFSAERKVCLVCVQQKRSRSDPCSVTPTLGAARHVDQDTAPHVQVVHAGRK